MVSKLEGGGGSVTDSRPKQSLRKGLLIFYARRRRSSGGEDDKPFSFWLCKKKHCSFEGWRTIRGLLVSHLFQGFNSPYSFFLMGSLVGNSGERS